MSATNWKTETVNVVDLLLDEANVRQDLGDGPLSQDALALDLFENQGAFELAQSIARNGLFQHELPIVIRQGQQYVVIEGNRRVAALKGFVQANLVPRFSARLGQLKKSNTELSITQIDVKVAPSRDAVAQLLAAIHTTESRKPWATLRQAYFYYAQIKSKKRTLKQLVNDYPNVDVPRFVRMWEMHQLARSISYDTPDEAEKVADQQSFPITTLERIYDSDAFQEGFGVSFDKTGKATIKADSGSFKSAYKQIITDILNKVVTSRTLNKAAAIKAYIESIDKPVLSTTTKPATAKDFKPKGVVTKQQSSVGLIPKDVNCALPYPGLKKILRELQALNYRKFPNAAHDLLRTFLECSLKAYFEYKGIQVPNKGKYTYLDDVLSLAETHFVTVKKPLVQIVKVIRGSAGNVSGNYLYSADFLNAVNHNHQVFSTGDQVKNSWDQMGNLIRYVLDPK